MYTFFYTEFYKFNQSVYHSILQQEESCSRYMLQGVHACSKLALSPIVSALEIIEGIAIQALLVISSIYMNQFCLQDHLSSLYMRCLYYPGLTLLDSVDYLVYSLIHFSPFKFYQV